MPNILELPTEISEAMRDSLDDLIHATSNEFDRITSVGVSIVEFR